MASIGTFLRANAWLALVVAAACTARYPFLSSVRISEGLLDLQRYLPFWAASLADRLVIFVIPLLVIVVPLAKVAGPLYRWRIRSRIYRWYALLLETDRKIVEGKIEDREAERRKLEELADELASVDVPLSYSDELYHLKQHVEYVSRRLQSWT